MDGTDLMEAGCPKGRIIGVVMDDLKSRWKESDFSLSKNELMEVLPTVLGSINVEEIEQKNAKERNKSK